jgi:hypothetical protein
MDATEVVDNLRPIGLIPANEAQARPLTQLEPEAQRIVWEVVKQTAPNYHAGVKLHSDRRIAIPANPIMPT